MALEINYFPEKCWPFIAIDTYVVIVRNKLRQIKYIIEVDDHRGLEAATLEFVSI